MLKIILLSIVMLCGALSWGEPLGLEECNGEEICLNSFRKKADWERMKEEQQDPSKADVKTVLDGAPDLPLYKQTPVHDLPVYINLKAYDLKTCQVDGSTKLPAHPGEPRLNVLEVSPNSLNTSLPVKKCQDLRLRAWFESTKAGIQFGFYKPGLSYNGKESSQTDVSFKIALKNRKANSFPTNQFEVWLEQINLSKYRLFVYVVPEKGDHQLVNTYVLNISTFCDGVVTLKKETTRDAMDVTDDYVWPEPASGCK